MKFRCPKCGFVFEGEKDVCPSCGAHFETVSSMKIKRRDVKKVCKNLESAKQAADTFERSYEVAVKHLGNVYIDLLSYLVYSKMTSLSISEFDEASKIKNAGFKSVADVFKQCIIKNKDIKGLSKNEMSHVRQRLVDLKDDILETMKIHIDDNNIKKEYRDLVIASSLADIHAFYDAEGEKYKNDFENKYLKSYDELKKYARLSNWIKGKKDNIENIEKNYLILKSKGFEETFRFFADRLLIIEKLSSKTDDYYYEHFARRQELITELLTEIMKVKVTSKVQSRTLNKSGEIKNTSSTPSKLGVSVTDRIKVVQQPRFGFLKVKDMEKTQLPINKSLHEDCGVSPQSIGLAVDY